MTILDILPPRVVLLGNAALAFDDASEIRLERKVAGLLAYLAVEGETSRGRLATLLWPETREDRARNNLSQALRRLKQVAGGASLIEGQTQVRLADGLEIDMRVLEEASYRRPGSETVVNASNAGHDGALLAGLDYRDCPDFDEWLQEIRGRLQNTRQADLEALADEADAVNDPRTALTHTLNFFPATPTAKRIIGA